MCKCNFIGILSASLLMAASGAHAALVGRLAATPGGTDYQAYYDTEANLTWLANANYGGTTMNWATANSWAVGLDINGVTGWRLPDTVQPDASCSQQSGGVSFGINCTGSEMGNLFYNALGNTAGSLSNTGPFSNVHSYGYWSATEFNTTSAWYFYMKDGNQSYGHKTNNLYAWAVHPGDVAAVPVPAAVWLFGSGLLGLTGAAKRRIA
ncbi:MAG: DUF1566 domain-containing protein [Gammaproteobacteria bacterium]|jgi:hypothetical protein